MQDVQVPDLSVGKGGGAQNDAGTHSSGYIMLTQDQKGKDKILHHAQRLQ